MRVAVVFSGLVRGNYEENIAAHRDAFPDADFYFSTWKPTTKREKVSWGVADKYEYPDTFSFISQYYPSPRYKGHPNKKTIQNYIKAYRKMKETNWDLSLLPDDYAKEGKEKIEDDFKHILRRGWISNKYQNRQQLIYAMTIRDLVDLEKYDVIVRARYDTVIHRDFRESAKMFCELAYDTKKPVGFHHFNRDGVGGIIRPERFIGKRLAHDLFDFMIIHRADMFDPQFVIDTYDKGKLNISEAGWWQVLVDQPKAGSSWEVKGYCRLHSQMVNERHDLRRFRKISTDDYWARKDAIKNAAPELMKFMKSDIADKIK